jgi:AraC-like DNA-binding protein
MQDKNKKIIELLCEHKHREGLSYRQLARQLGYSAGHLSDIFTFKNAATPVFLRIALMWLTKKRTL